MCDGVKTNFYSEICIALNHFYDSNFLKVEEMRGLFLYNHALFVVK